jgi:DNA-binding MarR family transcriptional regulator
MSQTDFGDLGPTASLVDRLARAVHCLQYAEGLNPAQWVALRYLGCANPQSRTPTGLAEFLATTKGTASQTLKALEQKGFVQRAQHRTDRRKSMLELTESGRATLMRDPLRKVQAAAAGCEAEIDFAIGTLANLVRQIQAGCGMREFGVCLQCGHRRTGTGCGSAVEEPAATTCGLTGEAIEPADTKKICVNYRRPDRP